MLRSIRNDMDVRDKWMGIKRLRSDGKPQPYHRKDKQRNTIPADQTAEAFAKHLEEIWTHMPIPFDRISQTKLPIPDLLQPTQFGFRKTGARRTQYIV